MRCLGLTAWGYCPWNRRRSRSCEKTLQAMCSPSTPSTSRRMEKDIAVWCGRLQEEAGCAEGCAVAAGVVNGAAAMGR